MEGCEMKYPLTFALVFLAILPSQTVAADSVSLSSIKVNTVLKAKIPYNVSLMLKKDGNSKITKACFLWSGEGPFCFPPVSVKETSVSLKLFTGNPRKYKLTGFVEYEDGGKAKKLNKVSAQIDVR